MTNPSFLEIRKNLYVIDHGMVRSFLCLGESEALLIDTGFGSGQIAAIVKSITALPVKVIFTHSDRDHIGNAEDFDDRWMHPAEFVNYTNKNENPLPMQALWENTILDIGTFQFEIILIPGHTPGCIALLERKKRFLIGGDSVQIGTVYMFGEGRNFPAYIASLKKLNSMKGDFDVVYACHNTLEVPSSILPTLIEAATLVMEHKLEGVDEPRFENKVKTYQYKGVGFYAK